MLAWGSPSLHSAKGGVASFEFPMVRERETQDKGCLMGTQDHL